MALRKFPRRSNIKGKDPMKKLILVTSPPACGKTFISRQLAAKLRHIVYLDKDTLIVLSKQIFAVAGEEYNRSSEFFEKNIRDYEYKAILALAMEALEYADSVLINAPFTKEIRNKEFIGSLKAELAKKGAKLCAVWVETSPEVCRQRMIRRNSDRDSWKLSHWDEYIKTVNFNAPKEVGSDLIVFKNSTREEFLSSMKQTLSILEK